MAQLIVKSPYLPPNSTGKIEGYLRYISTREGVEKIKQKDSVAYSDEDRKDIINELLKRYPDSVDFLEYKDFEKNPSRENADELITQITESHADFFSDRGTYLKYISERPRVQIVSKTGLFSDAEMDLNISRISREISESQSNVWTHIISLKREDAQRLGYDSVENWIPLLRSERNFIAQQMNIKPDNFRWYAAFHNESHHPHVHMVAYSVEPNEAFLNADGISNIKGELTKHIFRQDLMCLYDKQNESRDNLRQVGEQQIYDIIKQVNSRLYDNPKIEALLISLSEYLSDYEGKKVYGYFSTKGKRIVNSIVDEMEKDPIISNLYETWYSYKEQIIDIYSNQKLVRVPLSQNKDFKTIKNAIIKAAANLSIEPIDEKEYEKDSIFQPNIPNDCYVEKAEAVEETAINNIVTDNEIKHSEDYLSLKAIIYNYIQVEFNNEINKKLLAGQALFLEIMNLQLLAMQHMTVSEESFESSVSIRLGFFRNYVGLYFEQVEKSFEEMIQNTVVRYENRITNLMIECFNELEKRADNIYDGLIDIDGLINMSKILGVSDTYKNSDLI